MERIAQLIGENASFFDQYGNYVLIPVFVLIFIMDWRISKSNFSNRGKKIVRPGLTVLAVFLGMLIYLINFSFKPMVAALSTVDGSIGSEMVHFEYLNIATGEIEALKNYDEKIVLLNFWGTYCPPCIREFPDLQKLEEEFSEDLVVIAVSDEDPSKIEPFLSRVESPSIVGSQPNYSWINPEKFLPLTIIIDKGEVRSRFFGSRTYEEFVEIIGQVKSKQ